MPYQPYYPGGWQPGPGGGTPITHEALQHMETQYQEAMADLEAQKTSPGGTEPNRLARTDANGRVGDSGRLGGLLASAYATAPVGVTQLKLATGSVTSASPFNVQRYAFASPEVGGNSNDDLFIAIGKKETPSTSFFRMWQSIHDDSGSSRSITVRWDYLTASGNPRIWVVVDESGNIHDIWEAEDPADPEFPDDPPLYLEELPQSWALLPLQVPSEDLIREVIQRVERASLPSWHGRSVYRECLSCGETCQSMFANALKRRWLEVPDDVREVYSAVSQVEKRYWYLQLWLRSASRVLRDHTAETLIPLYREMLRVDKRTGRLQLK